MQRRLLLLGLGGCAIASCDRAAAARSIPHPNGKGAIVELFVARPAATPPRALVVMLHGHQPTSPSPGGHVFVTWGELDRIAAMGFLAASVSLPGFGRTTGPADFAGPYTQNAIAAVIADFEHRREIAPGAAIVVLGISLGAVAGALIAAREPRISGLVLISGAYDLPALFANSERRGVAEVRAQFERQTGGGEPAARSRSPLFQAHTIRARALILNGAQDDRTDPAQAQQFCEALVAAGQSAECVVYPNHGHAIPFAERRPRIDAFLQSILT